MTHTVYQAIAFAHPIVERPRADTRSPWDDPVLHRVERGYRVAMVVDAMPGIVECWPCWHVTVVLHAERDGKGIVREARPLGSWGGLREQGALFIVRRELRDVGEPDTEVILDRAATLAAWHKHRAAGGQHSIPTGVHGRKRMTQDEAETCFKTRREVLARLNPTYAMMQDGFLSRMEEGP